MGQQEIVNSRHRPTSGLAPTKAPGIAFLPAVPRNDRSLRLRVAESLRRAIVYGELAPGERILEGEIASQMMVSRGPVREALRLLEQEGLVVSYPNRGAVVAEITEKEFIEVLLPIRLTIERFALRCALDLLTEPDFERLAEVVSEMRIAAEQADLGRLVELDMQFHRVVVERAGQVHSLQLWEAIAPRIRGHFYRMGPHHRTYADLAGQHEQLLAKLRSGDEAEVLAALDNHIMETTLWPISGQGQSHPG